MALYEVSWTETIKYTAHIQAPSDEIVLANAGQDAISFAKLDAANGATKGFWTDEPVETIQSIGRVVHIEHQATRGKPAITEERVEPL